MPDSATAGSVVVDSLVSDSVGLSVTDVVRTFDKGSFKALDGVSLDVKPGQIVGLLGPNGAGKTTLVSICATLLLPDSGRVLVNGIDAVKDPKKARASMGLVLGGDLGFYPRASLEDNLLFFADVAGIKGSRKSVKAEVLWALEQVGLSDRARSKFNQLSKGMKQRLHIARAILGRPQVLLLDEPTSGLDPEIALEIRGLVRKLADDGAAILLTSHTLSEVESLASQIVVIGSGKVFVRGRVADVAAAAGIGGVSAFTVPALDAQLRSQIEALGPVSLDAANNDAQVSVRVMWANESDTAAATSHESLREILEKVVGHVPADLVYRHPTLEEDYLGLAPKLARE